MAQEGLFGNIYDAQLQDQLLRQKAATDYGTGWQAMTRAAAETGGMLGARIGEALGGVTPAMAMQNKLQSIANKFPDLDPQDPKQLGEVQSELWKGGMYDQSIKVSEMINDIRKAQEVDLNKQLLIQSKQDENKASAIATGHGVADSMESKKALLDKLSSAGLSNTNLYRNTQTDMTTLSAAGFKEQKFITQEERQKETEKRLKEAQATKVKEQEEKTKYRGVVGSVKAGEALVGNFLIQNEPVGYGDEEKKALKALVGAKIKVYDDKLSAERGAITPSLAEDYYTKVMALPEVYKTGGMRPIGESVLGVIPFTETEFDFREEASFNKDNFEAALDKAFGRGGQAVTQEEIPRYLKAGLLIPNVTIITAPNGAKVVATPKLIQQIKAEYGN